ncbi:phosphopantetheine-binding protein [Desulfovibrio sp. OttesenSCG-928-F07]|nr:phosphopantetheine-binding protein [Desulfovibrio sp. OttesenSCG-928-F07]
MDKNYIIETVNSALAEEFELDIETLKPEADIREDLRMDSLDMVDMILALERAFNFKLTDRSQVQHVKSMQDVYEFIEKLAAEGTING